MSEREPPTPDNGVRNAFLTWLGPAFALFFFLGLGYALIWLFGVAVYFAFRAGIVWGGVAAVFYAVLFFGVPSIDGQVFEHQRAKASANDILATPVDLTGKTVLFVGSSTRYHPIACSNLCQTLVLNSAAKAVYFGRKTSTQYDFSNGPIDIDGRTYWTFPKPVTDAYPITTAPVEVVPEKVDYVVIEGSMPRDLRNELAASVPNYVFYAAEEQVVYEFVILDMKGQTLIHPAQDDALFRITHYNRVPLGFPYVPGLAAGRRTYDHTHVETRGKVAGLRDSQHVDKYDVQTAEVLCGPQAQMMFDRCTSFAPWPYD